MNQLIALITNPILYTAFGGIVAAFYAVWTFARQHYLGVDKLFNLLALSLAAGWFGGWIVQSIVNRIWESRLSLDQLWVHPKPMVALVGYIGIWLVATRYIRSIRYPYWRLMDILFIALAIVQSALLLGWTIEQFDWAMVIALVGALLLTIGLVWLYGKTQRSGIVAGVQSAGFFGVLLVLYYMVPAWQGQSGSVEWIADVVGIVLGVTLVVLRISARSEQAILQDIPRGVSQNFYETFTRAFSKKPTNSEPDK